MKPLSVRTIRKIFHPNLDIDFCLELSRLLDLYKKEFKIDTNLRRVRFLAQVKHELGITKSGKVRIRENLNYKQKTLVRLSRYFRNNPNDLKKAMRLRGIQKQKFIAMKWYGKSKAKELGNESEIDGWRYRGFGVFQVTGKANIKRVFEVVEQKLKIECFDENGEVYDALLNSYFGAIISGMAFWYMTKMYECKSSLCVINKINRGLPRDYKEERVATAINIYKILKNA